MDNGSALGTRSGEAISEKDTSAPAEHIHGRPDLNGHPQAELHPQLPHSRLLHDHKPHEHHEPSNQRPMASPLMPFHESPTEATSARSASEVDACSGLGRNDGTTSLTFTMRRGDQLVEDDKAGATMHTGCSRSCNRSGSGRESFNHTQASVPNLPSIAATGTLPTSSATAGHNARATEIGTTADSAATHSPVTSTSKGPMIRSNNPFLPYVGKNGNLVQNKSDKLGARDVNLSGTLRLPWGMDHSTSESSTNLASATNGPTASPGIVTSSVAQTGRRKTRWSTSTTLVGGSGHGHVPGLGGAGLGGNPARAKTGSTGGSLELKKAALRRASESAALTASESVAWGGEVSVAGDSGRGDKDGSTTQERGREEEEEMHTESGHGLSSVLSSPHRIKRNRRTSISSHSLSSRSYKAPVNGLYDDEEVGSIDSHPRRRAGRRRSTRRCSGSLQCTESPESGSDSDLQGSESGDSGCGLEERIQGDHGLFDFPGTQLHDVPPHGSGDLNAESPYNHLRMCAKIDYLVEITTREYQRYDRGFTHPIVEPGEHWIQPLTTSFGPPPLEESWKAFVHPEGTRYFYCDVPEHPVPVITEAWIYDDEIRERIKSYMNQIFEFMRLNDIAFPRHSPMSPNSSKSPPTSKSSSPKSKRPSFTQSRNTFPQDLAPIVLVLELRLTGRVGYYFVSHPTQTLFWLDPFDFANSMSEVKVVHTGWTVGLQMRSQYWLHNEMFPHFYELRDGDLACVEDFLGFAIGDVLTSHDMSEGMSTEPRTLDQLKLGQAIVHRYEMKRWDRRRRSVGERRVICRILSDFYNERFVALYGERGARLSLTQSIHYSESRRQVPVAPPSVKLTKPWYITLLSLAFPSKQELATEGEQKEEADCDVMHTKDADPPPDPEARKMAVNSLFLEFISVVMFGSPTMHMKKLREMTVDVIVNRHALNRYAEKMVEEWRDITITGTVVLSANVSFLTIQSVDEAGSAGPNRTNAQRASYFSVLASMGTIVFSLLLLRQHREAMNLTFVAHRSVSRWGLESLALMYGMPFSLMIWSVISFFSSFAILWIGGGDNVVIGIASACCLGFAMLVIWATTAAYEKEVYESYAEKLLKRAKGAKHKVGKETVKVVRSATKRMSTLVDTGTNAPLVSRNPPASHRKSASSVTVGDVSSDPHFVKEGELLPNKITQERRRSVSASLKQWHPGRAWLGGLGRTEPSNDTVHIVDGRPTV